jgi:hypothetical protein
MSALLEPQELGLGSCAACDHAFRQGEPYHRGVARSHAAVLLYLVCERCAQHLLQDAVAAERFSDTLLETLNTAALAGMPIGGSA